MRRSISLVHIPGSVLITNDLGEYVIVPEAVHVALEEGRLAMSDPRYADIEARGLISRHGPTDGLSAIVKRTRKGFLTEGPSLHIFVVTLRCDHSCQYCQVSRAALNATGKDMTRANAMLALDRVFESDASTLTIEFQGGGPALRFDLVREIVQEAELRAEKEDRVVQFTMATTLHLLAQADLEFCRDHRMHLSTSLDGPEDIHASQRVLPKSNSWKSTIEALSRARAVLGEHGVAALPTITRAALSRPEDVVDAYVEAGFGSIFLRPLAPYGFARKTRASLGYSVDEFMTFYERALNYVLRLNEAGVRIEETTATIMLRHILTPFHSGYMDLRSPAGAGLGVLVYNYDGGVYPSDEARMAAETGDARFRLGDVSQPLDKMLSSDAMMWLAKGAIAERQNGCRDCAFVPYCGADPVHHAIVQGEPDVGREGTDFCGRHMAQFQLLFGRIAERDPDTMKTLLGWVFQRDRGDVGPGWVEH
ncbi:MAG: His-Xaa-Ser system radical SAM maturase HxsB [Hyphomonadaceae bacterium]